MLAFYVAANGLTATPELFATSPVEGNLAAGRLPSLDHQGAVNQEYSWCRGGPAQF